MNKDELITTMSEKSNLTKKDTEASLKAFIETLYETLAKNEKVQLVGFGTFEPREKKAYIGHNPKTKEPVDVPAKTVPIFKVGKTFKDALIK